METDRNSLKAAETTFRKPGGMLRTSEAMALGIHLRTTYLLRDSNRLILVSRGLYRLVGLLELSEPDLVPVARLVHRLWSVSFRRLHFMASPRKSPMECL